MLDKKIDDKVANEIKKIYNKNLDKRTDTMKNNQFNVEDIFRDIWGRESVSPQQRTILNNFSAKMT